MNIKKLAVAAVSFLCITMIGIYGEVKPLGEEWYPGINMECTNEFQSCA
jgi:hypothetical protein